MNFQQYLHKLGFITKGTSYHKIKCNTGVAKFALMMFELIKNSDFVGFQKLVQDCNVIDKKK